MGRPNRVFGLVIAAITLTIFGGANVIAKGVAPSSANCDTHVKASPLWRDCIGAAHTQKTDDELFYAGYWLAKNGRYDEALAYLSATQVRDERVLTYIGFATRKSGNVEAAMGFYNEALALNPDYTVARSYLGEAHLKRGEPDKARNELREISNRCGTSCAEYNELQDAITQFEATRS